MLFSRYVAAVLAFIVLALAPAASVGAGQPPDPGKVLASYDVGSLHIDEYGARNSSPLIFIPALFCGPWEWYGEIARSAPDHRVYVVALPGLAGKPPVATTSLLGRTTADFWRFIDERHVQNAVVIGHSLGGTIALLLAEQHPEVLRAAIAVDGGLITSPGIDPDDAKLRATQVERIAASVAQIPPAQFGPALRQYILPRLITAQSDVDAVADLGAKTDPVAAAQWMREALDADLRPDMPKMALPILEVMPFDPLTDPKADPRFATAGDKQRVYERLLTGAPHARVVSIVPSRHFVPYDQPQALHDAIAAFLATLS